MKIELVNLAVTGNAEQVKKGGVPSDTPHLKQDDTWEREDVNC